MKKFKVNIENNLEKCFEMLDSSYYKNFEHVYPEKTNEKIFGNFWEIIW